MTKKKLKKRQLLCLNKFMLNLYLLFRIVALEAPRKLWRSRKKLLSPERRKKLQAFLLLEWKDLATLSYCKNSSQYQMGRLGPCTLSCHIKLNTYPGVLKMKREFRDKLALNLPIKFKDLPTRREEK
jgi:hypothetical protein